MAILLNFLFLLLLYLCSFSNSCCSCTQTCSNEFYSKNAGKILQVMIY